MRRVLNSWWIVFLLSLSAMLVAPQVCSIERMQFSKALADLSALGTALELFYSRNARYPSTADGLKTLTPEFVRRISHDPWGNEYAYRASGQASYALYSIGVDAMDNGGAGDDVTTREKKYECSSYGVNCGLIERMSVLSVLLLASALVGLARGIRRVYRFL